MQTYIHLTLKWLQRGIIYTRIHRYGRVVVKRRWRVISFHWLSVGLGELLFRRLSRRKYQTETLSFGGAFRILKSLYSGKTLFWIYHKLNPILCSSQGCTIRGHYYEDFPSFTGNSKIVRWIILGLLQLRKSGFSTIFHMLQMDKFSGNTISKKLKLQEFVDFQACAHKFKDPRSLSTVYYTF